MTRAPRVRRNSLRRRLLTGKRVLAEWETELLNGMKRSQTVRAEIIAREARRQRITRVARQHGLTYVQFITGLKAIGLHKDHKFWGETAPELYIHSVADTIAEKHRA